MSATVPDDMLAAHPETAYFWGRVAGDGTLTDGCVTVRTTDETAAEVLSAVAGGAETTRDDRRRPYAHDTSITRHETAYTVQVHGPLADRASAALGLPLGDAPGGYRFDAISDYRRQLLRGLLEGCGTVCFKSDAEAVGISFVHDDGALLRTVQSLLSDAAVDTPHGDLAPTSSGQWFGLAEAAAPAFGDYLYEGSEDSGLFAPSRRRKLRRAVARVR